MSASKTYLNMEFLCDRYQYTSCSYAQKTQSNVQMLINYNGDVCSLTKSADNYQYWQSFITLNTLRHNKINFRQQCKYLPILPMSTSTKILRNFVFTHHHDHALVEVRLHRLFRITTCRVFPTPAGKISLTQPRVFLTCK